MKICYNPERFLRWLVASANVERRIELLTVYVNNAQGSRKD